ncbi:MAG: glucosamine-6-phosphate deaminase [Chloroflexota bacterium]
MNLVLAENYEELSRIGAGIVSDLIAAKPDAVIVPATGNTPMGLYRLLGTEHERGTLDASRVRVFQLDEYLGVPPGDGRSLYGWMLRSFIEPLGIPGENVVSLPWQESEVAAGCAAYDRALEAAGGFDLALLGLGPNGHVGFNEPPSSPESPTRAVDLTEESITSSATYWGGRDTVPRRAVTAGMGSLLAARHIVLLASGEHKRDILQRALTGPMTPDVPASYLRLSPNFTLLADRAAWPGGETENVRRET